MNMDRISETLGGPPVLQHEIQNEEDLFDLTEKGIPKKSLITLSDYINSPVISLVENILDLSYRSFLRKADTDLLNSTSTERVLNIAQVYALGMEVFDENKEELMAWMTRSHPVLGDKQPIELLKNGFGVKLVIDQLNRMEYGVYA